MKRTILLLWIGLISCGNGIPYSKIPESHFATHENIYSQVEQQNQSPVDVFSAKASSISASASVPATKDISNGYKPQVHDQSVHSAQGNPPFWWMTDNSPFQSNPGTIKTSFGVKSVKTHESAPNFQSNPFLSGNVHPENKHSNDDNNNSGSIDISNNPFLKNSASSSSSSSVYGIKPNTLTGHKTSGSQNPVFSQETSNVFLNGKHNNEGKDAISCSGKGKICVPSHLCINGYVSDNVKGITQIRTDSQNCEVNGSVCCTMKQHSESDQSSSGSSFLDQYSPAHDGVQVYQPSNTGIITNHNNDLSSSGGIFGNSYYEQKEYDFNEQHYPSTYTKGSENGYLPPLGSEATINVPSVSGLPVKVNPVKPPVKPVPEQDPSLEPAASGPAPTHLQLGCAAALICVEEQFCAMDGMISPTPLSLTSNQLLRRVPLSNCKNPDNGVIGKCCRDPNYVDPWPTGNLPANYTGGFDEQGFPTFLNIQKTRPAKKPSVPLKTGQFPVKTSPQYTVTPRPVQKQTFPSLSPQLGIKPQIPVSFTTSQPQFTYDPSPSNVNPTVIVPHVPGTQCGIKYNFPRRNLEDAEVPFGEIPWEAMILYVPEKKLLCSGAFVADNMVLTAANCVYGQNPHNIQVKGGEWKLGHESKDEEPLPFEIVPVREIIPHPKYVLGKASYDMAVLVLERPITLAKHIDTICLSQQPVAHPQPGRKCISTGWGKHILQAHLKGAKMHSIQVDTIDINECQERLSNAESQLEVDDSLVCVKAHQQKNNMCQVDLGGPLACEREDGYYEIVGVYSQDTGCIPTNQVATFALIDNSWVKHVMENPYPTIIEVNSNTPSIIHNGGSYESGFNQLEIISTTQRSNFEQVSQTPGYTYQPKPQPVQPEYKYEQQQPVQPGYFEQKPKPVQPEYKYEQQQPVTPDYKYEQQQPVKPDFKYEKPQPAQPDYKYEQQQPVKPDYKYEQQTVKPNYNQPDYKYEQQQPVKPDYKYEQQTTKPNYKYEQQPQPVQPGYYEQKVEPVQPQYNFEQKVEPVQPEYTDQSEYKYEQKTESVHPTFNYNKVSENIEPPYEYEQKPEPVVLTNEQQHFYQHNGQKCDCQQSYLPPQNNQYLPPVKA